MKTVDKHFETVIVTSMIAKQEVIIQCLDSNVVKGFIHPSIDPEGFSVSEHYVHWYTISSIELTDHYFEFWKDILPEDNDTFDE
ncbi:MULTISPECIES: hypothetical protein [unclassified Enterococcus]|uniref:hypothetical protein n=1 Tax=unclassified Enterococcus TaxID=2608891 RepID=UPI0013EAD465|nr:MULTISPECIES: hypothetical protein [unclassified Enterococcus]